MIGGILDPHSLENFIVPIGCYNKTLIEKAVHALLVRELYRDGKKVFSKEQMSDTTVIKDIKGHISLNPFTYYCESVW